MGNLSLTVLTSLALLVAYSSLISAAEAEASGDVGTQVKNELWGKRPGAAVWLQQFPFRRRVNDYDALNSIEKRFDDYGHMR